MPAATLHGEFSSADASGLTEPNARFTLYQSGKASSVTLDANDFVEVHSISVNSAGTNLAITIYDGADNSVGAGETLWKRTVPTGTGQDVFFGQPHVCQKGTYPKVLASASGQVDLTLRCTISRVAS